MEEAGKARRKKISAQELSERCGVSKRTVYYWLEEEYQLSAETFVRIVVGLHLPLYIHAVHERMRRNASVLWRPYDVLENPELLLYGHDL